MLPAPVKSIRDSGRAVKRLGGQAIQSVTEATLSQFLDLPEFRVLGYALEEQGEGCTNGAPMNARSPCLQAK